MKIIYLFIKNNTFLPQGNKDGLEISISVAIARPLALPSDNRDNNNN